MRARGRDILDKADCPSSEGSPKTGVLPELQDEFNVLKRMQDSGVECVPRLLSNASPTEDKPCLYVESQDGVVPLNQFKSWFFKEKEHRSAQDDRFKANGDPAEARRVREIIDKIALHSRGHDAGKGNFLVAREANASCPVTMINMAPFAYDASGEPTSQSSSWWWNCCKMRTLWLQLDCSGLDHYDTNTVTIPSSEFAGQAGAEEPAEKTVKRWRDDRYPKCPRK